ncbi:MAG: hypothetical protein LBN97_03995 [Oscillospiraceae bacterium]|jgi:hypothetical protein|nr:hypothetical protein [Oscillospiraceae bacterium]
MIEQYSTVQLKNGKIAIITEVLERDGEFGYVIEVILENGDYDVELIENSDIEFVIVEVKTPLSEYMHSDMRAKVSA